MTTPTTEETKTTIDAALDAAQGSRPRILSVSFLRNWSKAFAGVVTSLYKYVEFMAAQTFIKTATVDEITILGRTIRPLVEIGIQLGVGEPRGAQRWEGEATANVTIQGATLNSGTLFLNPDTGVTYSTIAPVALSGGSVTLQLRAIQDQANNGGFGAISNLDVGAVIVLAQPVTGIQPEITITTITKTGTNEEDPEVYRQRVLDRSQKRPQSAALVDYESRAEEVTGVIEAFPYTGIVPPEVDIYVNTTGTLPAEIAAIIANTQAFVEDPAWLPPGVNPVVQEVSRAPVQFVITNFTSTDDVSAKAAILAALTTDIQNRKPYIEGVSIPPRTDNLNTAQLTAVAINASSIYGATFDSMTFTVSGNPETNYTLQRGELLIMGAVNYA